MKLPVKKPPSEKRSIREHTLLETHSWSTCSWKWYYHPGVSVGTNPTRGAGSVSTRDVPTGSSQMFER